MYLDTINIPKRYFDLSNWRVTNIILWSITTKFSINIFTIKYIVDQCLTKISYLNFLRSLMTCTCTIMNDIQRLNQRRIG